MSHKRHVWRSATPLKQYRSELKLLLIAAVLLGVGILLQPWGHDIQADQTDDLTPVIVRDIQHDLLETRKKLDAMHDVQVANGVQPVEEQSIQTHLSAIGMDLKARNVKKGRRDLIALQSQVPVWQKKADDAIAAKKREAAARATTPAPAVSTGNSWQVPILMYHYTPGNFEGQLLSLKSKGYTAITFDQLRGAMEAKGPLPPKPVIITFDDGFSNQMTAFSLLKKYSMKATFYVMTGGEASQWCIGINRRFGDPLQPPSGCGDAYLNWSQIQELDQSGLITIGAHTVNHRNLAALSAAEQSFELTSSKQELEGRLGHAVNHLAYPYGGFSSTTINIARQAGYVTAVSTLPGSLQASGSIMSLHRVRDAYALP